MERASAPVLSFYSVPMENDMELLQAARSMNKDALVEIFDLYSSPLYNYALRLCSDPVLADHIVGDVFAKLVEQLSAGNGPTSNLRSYLYETAYHRIVDEARYSQRRAPLEVLASVRQDSQSASENAEDRIVFEQILQAIQHALTDDQRHVVILRFLEGFSLRETAVIMGKSVVHVKVIQTRAIAALRRSFNDGGTGKAAASRRVRDLSKAFEI